VPFEAVTAALDALTFLRRQPTKTPASANLSKRAGAQMMASRLLLTELPTAYARSFRAHFSCPIHAFATIGKDAAERTFVGCILKVPPTALSEAGRRLNCKQQEE
jgi:hypothetical protein